MAKSGAFFVGKAVVISNNLYFNGLHSMLTLFLLRVDTEQQIE